MSSKVEKELDLEERIANIKNLFTLENNEMKPKQIQRKPTTLQVSTSPNNLLNRASNIEISPCKPSPTKLSPFSDESFQQVKERTSNRVLF